MTRYLDRGPEVGDTVEVSYTTVVRQSDASCWGTTNVLPGYHLRTDTVDTADVRVIVPDPKVGDVVTADMDLPDLSLIEPIDGTGLAKRIDEKWYFLGDPQNPANCLPSYIVGEWRIVRIGGAA